MMSDPKILYCFTEAEMIKWEMVVGHHEEMLAWCKANGLEPKDVRAETGFTVEEIDGQEWIRYQRFIRSEEGHIKIDRDRDVPFSTEELAPMTVPLPAWVRMSA